MTKTLNLGVMGLGQMGQIHVRSVAMLPNARLHAVASYRADVARQVAARYQPARVYTDYPSFLADPDLDAVIIATAIDDHPAHIIQVAERGLHIFSEKPIGFKLAEVGQALAAVEKAGVHFQIGFMRRFDPAYAAARQKIEAGVIGRPVMLRANSRDPFWPEKQDAPGHNTLLLDLGVHGFDEARWLMGSEVTEVYTIGGALVYPKLGEFGDADNAIVSLKFASGAIGTLDFSRNARYGYDIRAEVLGDAGALQIGGLQQTQLLNLTPTGVTHDVYPWYPERFGRAFEAEIAAFVAALQAGRAPTPGPLDGRKATEIGLAAVKSLVSGRPVQL